MSSRILGVDPIACRAHGPCADEFPEAITLDEYGHPIPPTGPRPHRLVRPAKSAVTTGPVLAPHRETRR